MNFSWLFLPFIAFVVSSILTWKIRKLALKHGVLDHPNLRSSHSNPTPRGGGAAIVVATTAGAIFLLMVGDVEFRLALVVIVGGSIVATVGFLDDRGSQSVKVRLLTHVAVAVMAVVVLGGLPELQVGGRVLKLGWFGDILGVLAIVWTLNLFNFMDGIDGIAASEAIFVVGAGVGLPYFLGAPHSISPISLVFVAACWGFLIWNWPPAKIFMGDVGSGYLGYLVAVLAIFGSQNNSPLLFMWIMLGGIFFLDATLTLIRRLFRGEKIYEAHRSHAYQWLSRRWGSHLRVTLSVIATNIAWVLPLAALCVSHPDKAWWIFIVGLAPLGVFMLFVGAGRPEA